MSRYSSELAGGALLPFERSDDDACRVFRIRDGAEQRRARDTDDPDTAQPRSDRSRVRGVLLNVLIDDDCDP